MGNLVSKIAQKHYLPCEWTREVGGTGGCLEGERLASAHGKNRTGKKINKNVEIKGCGNAT
jgi:hypothetical protein